MDDFAIPTKAGHLATRLIRLLRPFLSMQTIPGGNPASVDRDWLQEKALLSSVFQLALRVAVRLLVSTSLYRCILPVAGVSVNRSMTVDLDNPYSRSDSRPVVAVTLVPGLQSCAADQRDLSFKRFVTVSEAPENMSWDIWCQPVVLPK
jgi:hypothetical protein